MAKVKKQTYEGDEIVYRDADGKIYTSGDIQRHIMTDGYPLKWVEDLQSIRKSPRGYRRPQQGRGSREQRYRRECWQQCADRWREMPLECPPIPPCPQISSKKNVWKAAEEAGILSSYYDHFMGCCMEQCKKIDEEESKKREERRKAQRESHKRSYKVFSQSERSNYRERLEEIRSDSKRETTGWGAYYNTKIKNERAALKSRIGYIRLQYKEWIKLLKGVHKTRLANIRAEFKSKLETPREKYKKDVAYAKKYFPEKLPVIRQKYRTDRAALASEKQNRMNQVREQYKTDKAPFDTYRSTQTAIEKYKCADMIASLRKSRRADLAERRKKYKPIKAEAREEYRQNLTGIKETLYEKPEVPEPIYGKISEKNECWPCEYPHNEKIGYTTLQMTAGESQTLIIENDIPGTTYVWTLEGGGFLDRSEGDSVIYTAPSTNPNCSSNPTITLWFCEEPLDTIQLAVTEAGAGGLAYSQTFLDELYHPNCNIEFTDYWGPLYTAYRNHYNCWGEIIEHAGWGWCFKDLSGSPEHPIPCTTNAGLCGLKRDDRRTDAQKAAGCCPKGLL